MWERRQLVFAAALLALLVPPALSAQEDTSLSAAEIRALTDDDKNVEAAEAARALLETVKRQHGDRSLEVAGALELLARALARAHQGDPTGKAERLELAERALDIRRELSDENDIALAWSHYVVGLVHNLVWEGSLALESFQHALRIAETHYGEGHPETERYVREYGTAIYLTGRYEVALELFERHLKIAVAKYGVTGVDTLSAYYNLALTHQVLGNLDVADRHLKVAEKVLKKQNPVNGRDLIWVRNLRSTMMELQGRLADSLSMFEETLALALDLLGPDSLEVARQKNHIARNLIDLGDYERARDLLSQTLQEFDDESEGFVRCSLLYNQATAHHALGELDAARASFGDFAKAASGVVDPGLPLWAEFHETHAAVLYDLGDPRAARAQLDLALAIRRTTGQESIHYAETLARSGSLHLAMGDAATARKELSRATEIIERIAPTNHRYYVANEDLAEALFAAGESTLAFEAAIRAASASTEFDRATIALLPRRQAMARALRPHIARDIVTTLVLSSDKVLPSWKGEAYTLLLRSRAMIFDEMAARERRWADTGKPEVLSRIDEWTAARTHLANLFMIGPRDDVALYVARMETAQQTVERLERGLAQVSREHRELFRLRNAGLDKLRETMKPGEASVSYLRFGRKTATNRERVPHYAVAVLRAGDARPEWFDLGPARDIERTIGEWRAAFDPLSVGGEKAHRRVGHALRRLLWDPLETHLADTKTVFVVPDAAIHLVSFIGLPLRDDAYLIDHGPDFHYLTAERDLIRMEQPRETLAGGLLVVGNPAFDGRRNPAGDTYRGTGPTCAAFRSRNWTPLPGTRDEARTVRRLWKTSVDEPVTELTGTRATEGAVKKAVSGRRVIHLATHGFFLGAECSSGEEAYRGIGSMSSRRRPEEVNEFRIANPLLMSGLVFAGANRLASHERTDKEDGVLTAEEVGALDLRGVELAVLSACRTGAGSVTEGEGMFGLRRAFLLAGARTVVTNLWDVEDQTARLWIERLYRERFLDARSIPAAMRAASSSVLEARRAAGLDTHPFFWAGWLAVGGR